MEGMQAGVVAVKDVEIIARCKVTPVHKVTVTVRIIVIRSIMTLKIIAKSNIKIMIMEEKNGCFVCGAYNQGSGICY